MESHRARQLRLELERQGYTLRVQYDRPGGPTFQVTDGNGELVAGDSIDGCALEAIERWAWPDQAR